MYKKIHILKIISNRSIWSKDGMTTPGQSEPKCNGNKEVTLHSSEH